MPSGIPQVVFGKDKCMETLATMGGRGCFTATEVKIYQDKYKPHKSLDHISNNTAANRI